MSTRLLQRNTRFLLIWLPLVLLTGSIVFYAMLLKHAHHMQEKQLTLKQANIWNAFVSRSGHIDWQVPGEYDIIEGTTFPQTKLNAPLDTAIYYTDSKQLHPFKKLTGHLSWNGKSYLVTTYISSTEFSHLIIKVFVTEAFILALLLIAIIIINRISSGRLWKPFLNTVEKVNTFDVTRNESLTLPAETGTTEFNELNVVINGLIYRINAAYNNQKQFVENASHEMQTPLAIIRSKLELLINQPGLTEKNAALIGDITAANDRLSQMNRTLLLLAKIENNQFPDTEPVEISQLLQKIIAVFKGHYEELPTLHIDLVNTLIVPVNHILIDLMLTNLIKNAIEHNQPDGHIKILLSDNILLIENTGQALHVDPNELFERFKKGSHQTKTTGLGLALVKQICNLYQFKINYHYNDGWHRVMMKFDEAAG